MRLLAKLELTLPERYYLGVDIGYKAHVACVIPLPIFAQGDDQWKRQRCLEFPSTARGLAKLQTYLDRFTPDPSAFLGICEPTGGYYGATLHCYLLDQGYNMWLVENHTTKTMREKIFGSLPKTDEMDARVMARICYLHEAVGEEFALRPLRLMSPDDRELLALCRESWKLKQTLTGYKNHFTQLMAVVFPELKTFFTKSVSTVAPVKLIAVYPTPAEIAAAPATDLKALLWQAEAYHHAKRVDALQELARRSSGLLPDPARAWRLQWLTQLLLANYTGRKELDRQLKAIVRQRPEYQWIQDVPYATETTLGTIIAATGDIHRFRNMRRYVAYTGFFPGLQTSQTINRTRMSKRGNRDLKRTYFQIAAMLVWFDPRPNRYKVLFERKLAEGRPWYKAMPFVCAALARHIYHCLKHEEPYDAERAFGGSPFYPAIEQENDHLEVVISERFVVMNDTS